MSSTPRNRLLIAVLIVAIASAFGCGKPQRYGAVNPFAYPVVPSGGSVGDLCSLDGGTAPGVCGIRGISLPAPAAGALQSDGGGLFWSSVTSGGSVSYTPGTAGNWPQGAPTTVAGALDLSAAGATAANTSLVYRPGGIAGGSVYTTWPALMAACGASTGKKVVIIDGSISPCHATAGTWDVSGITFISKGNALLSSSANTLTCDNGCAFSSSSQIVLDEGVRLLTQSTAPVWSTASPVMYLRGAASLVTDVGAAPFVSCTSGTGIIAASDFGFIGNGTDVVVTASSGATMFVDIVSGRLYSNALSGAGSITVQYSSSSTVSATQPGITGPSASVLTSVASQVSYTPTTPANWSPSTGLTSATALDQLAAPALNTSSATVACGTGGTQTISVAQGQAKGLIVTSGTLSSNCVLDFSTNASSGLYQVDMSGVTIGSSFGVQFKNGTATKTYLSAATSNSLATVYTHGANTLAVQF